MSSKLKEAQELMTEMIEAHELDQQKIEELQEKLDYWESFDWLSPEAKKLVSARAKVLGVKTPFEN